MPEDYLPKKSTDWTLTIIIIGAAIAVVGGIFLLRFGSVGGTVVIKSPSKPKSPGPYKFASQSSEKVNVPLPAPYGRILYMQDPSSERAIRLFTNKYKGLDCPYARAIRQNPRINLYWYPEKNGKGPYLRLEETGVESIIDVQRSLTRRVHRMESYVFVGDYATDGTESVESTQFGKRISNVNINGFPAEDMTSTFGMNRGKYIGTITWAGKKLEFRSSSP